MRVLHTSDWHVGRTFHGRILLTEQEQVLSGLADLVADQRIDVVVVAGDVYDRTVPSAEAMQVCQRVLASIRAAGAEIVLTPGNHDSAPRIGTFADFAAAGGLHLRTRISQLHEPVVLADRHGPVAFYGIPYLEPDPARYLLGIQDEAESRSHRRVLSEAMDRVRASLARRGDGARSVVLAHAFVTGGTASESERRIEVGGAEQAPASVFHGVDYVALGHLHGPQSIREAMRYSGSPLAYSFSEARQRKSVWVVELDHGGFAGAERIELPVPRRLDTVSGYIEELLTDPRHAELEDRYLAVTLLDRVQPIDGMRRLQQRFPHAVQLTWQPADGLRHEIMPYSQVLRAGDERDVIARFVADCRGCEPSERERDMLGEALRAIGQAEVSG